MISTSLNPHDVEFRLTYRRRIFSLHMHRPTCLFLLGMLSWLVFVPFLGWSAAAAACLALLLHEMGHALAARLMGYDISALMLIPLLGGCVMFDEELLNQRDRAIIVLAGPATGTVTGAMAWGIYAWTGWFPAASYAAWAILLTVVNLVPLVPMDGGQTMESLLQPCRTKFRVAAFVVVAFLSIAAAAAVSPMLGISTVIMIYALLLVANGEWNKERRWLNVCRVMKELTGSDDQNLADSVLIHPNEHEIVEAAHRAYRPGSSSVCSLIENKAALVNYVKSRAVVPMGWGWKAVVVLGFVSLFAVTAWLTYLVFLQEGNVPEEILRMLAPRAYDFLVGSPYA